MLFLIVLRKVSGYMHQNRLSSWLNSDVLGPIALSEAQRQMADDGGSSEWLADSYRFPAVDDAREAYQIQ